MNVNLIRRSEADYLPPSTDSERTVSDKPMADTRALLSQQSAACEPLITSPQERLLADRFRSELRKVNATLAELAVNASTVAARGGEVVGEVVDTMRGITKAPNASPTSFR